MWSGTSYDGACGVVLPLTGNGVVRWNITSEGAAGPGKGPFRCTLGAGAAGAGRTGAGPAVPVGTGTGMTAGSGSDGASTTRVGLAATRWTGTSGEAEGVGWCGSGVPGTRTVCTTRAGVGTSRIGGRAADVGTDDGAGGHKRVARGNAGAGSSDAGARWTGDVTGAAERADRNGGAEVGVLGLKMVCGVGGVGVGVSGAGAAEVPTEIGRSPRSSTLAGSGDCSGTGGSALASTSTARCTGASGACTGKGRAGTGRGEGGGNDGADTERSGVDGWRAVRITTGRVLLAGEGSSWPVARWTGSDEGAAVGVGAGAGVIVGDGT